MMHPSRTVTTISPRSSLPSNGSLVPFDRYGPDTLRRADASNTTMSAAASGSSAARRPMTAAGATAIARTTAATSSMAVMAADSAVSSPMAPGFAYMYSNSFSSRLIGTWSAVMHATVPSRIPSTSASRSDSVRSGGSRRVAVSYTESSTAASVNTRWRAGAAAETARPSDRACRS